jgi:hypothetical protein
MGAPSSRLDRCLYLEGDQKSDRRRGWVEE